MKKEVFVEYAIGPSARTIARRLRRMGYEAHVENGYLRVSTIMYGKYKDELFELRAATVRAGGFSAIAVDWGVLDRS